jgi:hypothetical protein
VKQSLTIQSLGRVNISLEVCTCSCLHYYWLPCIGLFRTLRYMYLSRSTVPHAKYIIEVYIPLEQPMMPIKLLKNRNYVAVSCSACVGTMIYFSMNILWPQQVAALYETDQTAIGWLSVCTYHSNTLRI